jgi:hypothetical protein
MLAGTIGFQDSTRNRNAASSLTVNDFKFKLGCFILVEPPS